MVYHRSKTLNFEKRLNKTMTIPFTLFSILNGSSSDGRHNERNFLPYTKTLKGSLKVAPMTEKIKSGR